MTFKEKLENLKNELVSFVPVNRDFEFEATLEDHTIEKKGVYRLHYINYHRFGEGYGMGPNNVGMINWPFSPFVLPSGMSSEDAFKVLSYLTDFIERKLNLQPCSQKSVQALNDALDLERLGFTRVEGYGSEETDEVVDLFTVTGRLELFKKSQNYSKYFEWYTEHVTLEEVQDIYRNCGMEFSDLVLTNKEGKVMQKC